MVLAAGEQDRTVLASVATHQPFQFHFAQSCEDASNLARQLRARVILFDRNWPGTDWRTAVESLATAPHATVRVASLAPKKKVMLIFQVR